MGSSPRTTEFLKECMADSFLRLMKEKSFDKITVNEIAENAGVNRSTRFRNFKTKNDAVTFKLMQPLKTVERGAPENAGEFFSFAYSVKDILSAVYHDGLQSCAYDAYCRVAFPSYSTNPIACYGTRFFASGLFGLLDEWISRDFKESVERRYKNGFGILFSEQIRELQKPTDKNSAGFYIKFLVRITIALRADRYWLFFHCSTALLTQAMAFKLRG